MKTSYLPALLVLIAMPASLFADPVIDRKIEDAAKASYNYRTVLNDQVTVKAADGVVTLTGRVEDQSDKALAADTVKNLPGVVNVDNQLSVEPSHPMESDEWMAMKIRGLLLVKAKVSATSTSVAVKNAQVTLSGTAENQAQKDLTGIYAKEIQGVKTVTNNLQVQPKAAAETTKTTVGEKIDDASITSQVKFALLSHKSTSALTTKVTTTDGVVRVTGEAKSAAEKALVTKLASDVRGTKSVTNDMTVKS
jgi:hyperosmotically inducible periplasmic protein